MILNLDNLLQEQLDDIKQPFQPLEKVDPNLPQPLEKVHPNIFSKFIAKLSISGFAPLF